MSFANLDISSLYFAMHVIGFVSWVSGLLYFGRVLVYHSEAYEKEADAKAALIETFTLMEKRVNGLIAFPAMVLTLVAGFLLMFKTKAYFFPWFQIKFFLIMVLVVAHLYYGIVFVKFKRRQNSSKPPFSPNFLRAYNELVTLIFIMIVFAASVKVVPNIIALWGVTILFFGLGFLLFRVVKKKKQS